MTRCRLGQERDAVCVSVCSVYSVSVCVCMCMSMCVCVCNAM